MMTSRKLCSVANRSGLRCYIPQDNVQRVGDLISFYPDHRLLLHSVQSPIQLLRLHVNTQSLINWPEYKSDKMVVAWMHHSYCSHYN